MAKRRPRAAVIAPVTGAPMAPSTNVCPQAARSRGSILHAVTPKPDEDERKRMTALLDSEAGIFRWRSILGVDWMETRGLTGGSLTFQGKELDPDTQLADAGVCMQATVDFVGRLGWKPPNGRVIRDAVLRLSRDEWRAR